MEARKVTSKKRGQVKDWSKVKPNELWKADAKVFPYNARTKMQTRAAMADKRRGRRQPYGNSLFWHMFYMLYLNRNRLYISQAYQMAVDIFRKKDQLAVIPTLHQVKYQVSKLDPAVVYVARYGEEGEGK